MTQSISEILKEYLENEDKEVITITAYIEQDLNEEVPSGKKDEIYSAEVLKDWDKFVKSVKKIILAKGVIVKHTKSPSQDGISEYINFYIVGKNGFRKNGLINLRLSEHSANSHSKSVRRTKKNEIDTDNVNLDITVSKGSDTKFDTYEDALAYLQSYIDRNYGSKYTHVSDPSKHVIASKNKNKNNKNR